MLYKSVFWSSIIRVSTALASLLFFWLIGKNKMDIEIYSQVGFTYSLAFLLDLGYFKSIRNKITNQSAYSLHEVLINSSFLVISISTVISLFLHYEIPVFLLILLRYINSTGQEYLNSISRQVAGQKISLLGLILSIMMFAITQNLVNSILVAEIFIALWLLLTCTFEIRPNRLRLSPIYALKGVDILSIQILLLSFIPFDRYILIERIDYDISNYEIIMRLSGMIFFPINVLQLFLWTESAKKDKNINPMIVLRFSAIVVFIMSCAMGILMSVDNLLSLFFPLFNNSPDLYLVLFANSFIVLISLQSDILFGFGKRRTLLKYVSILVILKFIMYFVFEELILGSAVALFLLFSVLYYEIGRNVNGASISAEN